MVGTNDATLIGVQARTGRPVWRFQTEDAIKHRPAIDTARAQAIAGSHDGGIYAVGLADGQLRWRVRTGNVVYSTPMIDGDVVYAGSTDKQLYAIGAEDGAVRAKKRLDSKIMGSPVLVDGAIAVGTNSGAVHLLEVGTLKKIGRLQFADCVTNAVAGSPELGLIFVKTYADHVVALRRTDAR